MAETLTGGCACGALRYALESEPFDPGWCHCRTCQLVSGAPAMAFASVPAGGLVFTRGEDRRKRFQASHFGQRQYCAVCVTSLTIQVYFQPDTLDYPIATLDDPERIAPAFHIFRASRIGWFETADALPRHDRFRPDTRGLEGTEPPA